MKKPLSQDLIVLQHQLMMVLGMTDEADEMLQNFAQQAIKSLQLTAVYIDQKAYSKTDLKRSLTYLSNEVKISDTAIITQYETAKCPENEAMYLDLFKADDKYWYCFSLKHIGYMALETPQLFSNNEIIPALTEVIQRMCKTYNGRKQTLLNQKQKTKIKIISSHLQYEKLKLEHVLCSIKDCILVLDREGSIHFTNLAANVLFGGSTTEMKYKHFTDYFRIHDLESNVDITRAIVDYSMNVGLWSDARPVILKTSQNKELFVRLNVKSMIDEEYSEEGSKEYFVATFHDMTESYKLEQKLQWQATHDALTGCLNRHGFQEQLEHHLSSRKLSGHLSFISIDLDRFKLINDISGHHAGDVLLQQVTQLIEHELSGQGSLARLGGDEFGIILNDVQPKRVEDIAENIRHSIDRLRFKWEDNIFTIGASLGIAHIRDDETDINEVLVRADEACLQSKENGRNQVTVSPTTINNKPNETHHQPSRNYLHCINRALSNSDEDYKLVLYKQSIRSISGHSTSDHHEVLLRLLHKNTVIPPDTFLPAAERSGIVREIDLFVLTKTLEHLKKNVGSRYNINLSGVSLSDDITRQRIFALISKHPSEAKFLCLEITETAAITNLTKCIRFMDELNELGVSFALDDFGTGVSSFSYLKSLPIKYLKIDGSFIHNICNNEIDEIVVQSIVSASKAMKIRTVAEYVSDEDTLSKVTSLGIDYAQGYWMGVPTRLH